jgi:hypothetical protein
MTTRVTTDVSCDNCGDWIHGMVGTKKEKAFAVRKAKRVGWVHQKPDDDLCPKCWREIGSWYSWTRPESTTLSDGEDVKVSSSGLKRMGE